MTAIWEGFCKKEENFRQKQREITHDSREKEAKNVLHFHDNSKKAIQFPLSQSVTKKHPVNDCETGEDRQKPANISNMPWEPGEQEQYLSALLRNSQDDPPAVVYDEYTISHDEIV